MWIHAKDRIGDALRGRIFFYMGEQDNDRPDV